MHPKNVELLKVAGIDICILGNNHVMNFGRAGLIETLDTLQDNGIKTPVPESTPTKPQNLQ